MELYLLNESDENYINQIINLEAEIFGENGAVDLWNLKPLIKYGKVYVLLQEKKVLACAELTKDWNGQKAYLYGFAVKLSEQKRGFGKTFLSMVIKECIKEKINEIELTVSPENAPAIFLYEKFGFTKIKYLNDEYGKGINRYLYKKLL